MHEALLDLDLPSPPADIKMKVGRRFRKTATDSKLGVTSQVVIAPEQTHSFKIEPSSLLRKVPTAFV